MELSRKSRPRTGPELGRTWDPIEVYGPCPEFAAGVLTGYRIRRRIQLADLGEVEGFHSLQPRFDLTWEDCYISHRSRMMGDMTDPVLKRGASYRVRLDDRRRPTLPPGLLEEAGIVAGHHELVAHVEGPGRVVLEDPMALLGAVQQAVAAGKRTRGVQETLVNDLLADRSDDASLR